MTFKEWFFNEEGPWGGASFDGTSSVYVNTPDYWPNSKYQGPGIKTPGFLKQVDKKFGGKHYKTDKKSPIEDRVPKIATDEKEKEEKQGMQYCDSEDGDERGEDTIYASNDPTLDVKQKRKVNQLYKPNTTYKLK